MNRMFHFVFKYSVKIALNKEVLLSQKIILPGFNPRSEIMKCKCNRVDNCYYHSERLLERKKAAAFYIYLVRINLALVGGPT